MLRIARLVPALLSCPAEAHPLDEVVQGAYLTLAPNEVRLQIDLIPGAKVAGVLLKSLDSDGDRQITDREARDYAERVLAQSALLMDGAPALWRLEHVKAPPYESIELAGETIEIFAVTRRADQAGVHTLSYENRYAPAKCLCIANIFLEPGSGWRYRVTGQTRSSDGRGLTVTYSSVHR